MTMIYGGSKGFVPTNSQPLRDPTTGAVTAYGEKLGYKSDPFIYGGGAIGGENQNFMAPNQSKTGQPVPASFELMSNSQKEQFATQGGAQGNQRLSNQPLGTTPVGYQPYGNTVLPVYEQLQDPQNYPAGMTDPNEQYFTGYRYVPYNVGGTPALVRVKEYNVPMSNLSPAESWRKRAEAGEPGAMETLFRIDPVAATQLMLQQQQAQQGQGGAGNGGGMWGGQRGDRNIENEAIRRRNYDIQSRNYARAGLPSPTLLDIPRVENWQGPGEAPYQRYGREVQNGYALPFDYEVGSPFFNRSNTGLGGGNWGGRGGFGGRPGGGRPNGEPQNGGQNNGPGMSFGGWLGGDVRTPEPVGGNWGGRPAAPNMGPWFNQLPWWARGTRTQGPALGSGLMTGG